VSILKKLIAIDLLYAERYAKEQGLPYFPMKDFIRLCSAGNVDVIEVLCTLQRRVPENDSAEALGAVMQSFERKRYPLEMCGAKIIECPAKRSQSSQSGYKQSDDQRLMIKTLTLAMKLRPDFVMLVAADGDYAPMVEALRDEGIRTEIIAAPNTLASELRRHAKNVIDLETLLQQCPLPPVREDQNQ
jgi:uncharacterized LabA/DUF88 family protein